ncbi:MAG TPA: hypothetical protein PKM88_05350 [bacterium]|nr:hypothetical protein [bacterium]
MKSETPTGATHYDVMAACMVNGLITTVMTAAAAEIAKRRAETGMPVTASELIVSGRNYRDAVLRQLRAEQRRIQRDGLAQREARAVLLPPPPVQYLTTTQAARMCGIGLSTVRHAVAEHPDLADKFAATALPGRGRPGKDSRPAVSYRWTQQGLIAFLSAVRDGVDTPEVRLER